ncbi:MAG: hypothetical protein JXR22_13185 [Prolixibacteraceae bacterium]|nr:hypothetical protein [Prolixibacteraceae bacterium]
MKKQIIISLLLVLTSYSCVEKYDRNLKDILGEWKLHEMSYTKESGEYIVLTEVSSSIIFSNNTINNIDGTLEKYGTLIVDGDSVAFVYQFDFSQNKMNIDIERTALENKPLYTFGKMQVNDFELDDVNRLIFSCDFEIIYPTNEELTHTVYIFER